MSELKIWPWDFGDKPYFVNDEGYHWFIDKTSTKSYRSRAGGNKLVFFIVAVLKDGKYDPVERVLMDSDTNNVLYSSPRLEDIACHADMVCLHNTL